MEDSWAGDRQAIPRGPGRDFDELRRTLGALNTPGNYGEAALAAITASEEKIAAVLKPAKSSRPQASEGLGRMHTDFGAFVASRKALVRTDEPYGRRMSWVVIVRNCIECRRNRLGTFYAVSLKTSSSLVHSSSRNAASAVRSRS